MKAISLLQPWATLVVIGVKTIETRSWNTHYRGDILIHAAKSKKGSIFVSRAPFKKYIPDFDKLPFGAIIGQATITNIIRMGNDDISVELMNKLSMEERVFGDYGEGRYAWMLENFMQFRNPIPARGSLNIWEYPFEIID